MAVFCEPLSWIFANVGRGIAINPESFSHAPVCIRNDNEENTFSVNTHTNTRSEWDNKSHGRASVRATREIVFPWRIVKRKTMHIKIHTAQQKNNQRYLFAFVHCFKIADNSTNEQGNGLLPTLFFVIIITVCNLPSGLFGFSLALSAMVANWCKR